MQTTERIIDTRHATLYRGPCLPRMPIADAAAAGIVVFGVFTPYPSSGPILLSTHPTADEAIAAARAIDPAVFVEVHANIIGMYGRECLAYIRHKS